VIRLLTVSEHELDTVKSLILTAAEVDITDPLDTIKSCVLLKTVGIVPLPSVLIPQLAKVLKAVAEGLL
jgi:hypothetical protein